MARLWKILSIDGGGIRGLIPAEILRVMETRTGGSIGNLFDVFGGTSTGGLIALALTSSAEKVKSADALVELYKSRGTAIFPPSYFEDVVLRRRSDIVSKVRQVFRSKYRAEGLESELEDMLGDSMIKDATKEVLVTSYDIAFDRSFVFSRLQARSDAEFDCKMTTAARATSAAPTYFDPVKFSGAQGKNRLLIDGGLFANNPSFITLKHVLDRLAEPDDSFLLVSVGTGRQVATMSMTDVQAGGLWSWRKDALRIVFKNSMVLAEEAARNLMSLKGGQYFRLQIDIPTSLSQTMDDTRSVNLESLRKLTDKVTGSNEFDKLCEALKS